MDSEDEDVGTSKELCVSFAVSSLLINPSWLFSILSDLHKLFLHPLLRESFLPQLWVPVALCLGALPSVGTVACDSGTQRNFSKLTYTPGQMSEVTLRPSPRARQYSVMLQLQRPGLL